VWWARQRQWYTWSICALIFALCMHTACVGSPYLYSKVVSC
jgi:hypothetical protein